jgi:hypothetical protein
MGASGSAPIRSAVPEGKIRLCVAGFKISHHTGRAQKLAVEIQRSFPDQYETWFYFSWPSAYRAYLTGLLTNEFKPAFEANPDSPLKGHMTSPICWLEEKNAGGETVITPLGGRDRFCEWALSKHNDSPTIHELATTDPGVGDAWVDETPGTAQSS